jgi:hypothetical protein
LCFTDALLAARIASSAKVYAGSEIDRSQVQQFISLLTRLAIVADGSIVLISHPSLTGINTESGLSGSTQWHNAVRARFYMKGVKPTEGEQPDNDLREIVFKKNQYGPISDQIVLRWQDGMYLPVPGTASLDQAAQETKADEIFLDLLRRFTRENRFVSGKPSSNYAPALFAKEEEAKRELITSKMFEAAMRRLFKTGMIWNEPCGKPSRPRIGGVTAVRACLHSECCRKSTDEKFGQPSIDGRGHNRVVIGRVTNTHRSRIDGPGRLNPDRGQFVFAVAISKMLLRLDSGRNGTACAPVMCY